MIPVSASVGAQLVSVVFLSAACNSNGAGERKRGESDKQTLDNKQTSVGLLVCRDTVSDVDTSAAHDAQLSARSRLAAHAADGA